MEVTAERPQDVFYDAAIKRDITCFVVKDKRVVRVATLVLGIIITVALHAAFISKIIAYQDFKYIIDGEISAVCIRFIIIQVVLYDGTVQSEEKEDPRVRHYRFI